MTTEVATIEERRPKPTFAAGGQVGALIPQTLEEAYRLADVMSRSGMAPSTIRTPEAVLVAIMAGAELGFPPFQALQSFAVINNRPSIWGDAIPALLWSRGFKLREWFEGEAVDYPDQMAAICEITRPDGQIIGGAFSVADAKEAKLWSKDGPWQTAKKRMLKMRARAFAARDGAADLLRGLFVAEEVQDFEPIPDATTGTGMRGRLEAKAQPVDPDGFNVRKIADGAAEAKAKKKPDPEPEPETVTEAVEAEFEPVVEGAAEDAPVEAPEAAVEAVGDVPATEEPEADKAAVGPGEAAQSGLASAIATYRSRIEHAPSTIVLKRLRENNSGLRAELDKTRPEDLVELEGLFNTRWGVLTEEERGGK